MLRDKKAAGPRQCAWSDGMRTISIVLLVTMAPLLMQGCVKIRIEKQSEPLWKQRAEQMDVEEAEEAPIWTPDGSSSAFSFLAVEKPQNRGNRSAAVSHVVSALYQETDDGPEVVWRESKGSWSVWGLQPGEYTIRVERVFDGGQAEEASGDTDETFTLRPGEAAEAQVVLKKTPWGLIILLSVTIVLLVVLLIILAEQGDIDLPSPADMIPPPDLLLPPRILPPDVVGHVMIDFVGPPHARYAPRWRGGLPATYDARDSRRTGPVEWYGPPPGETVDSDATVELMLRDPVDELTVDQRTLAVFTPKHRILGSISVSEGGRHLRLSPMYPLPAGEEITVRFLGEYVKVEGARREGGNTIEENYSWSFRVSE